MLHPMRRTTVWIHSGPRAVGTRARHARKKRRNGEVDSVRHSWHGQVTSRLGLATEASLRNRTLEERDGKRRGVRSELLMGGE